MVRICSQSLVVFDLDDTLYSEFNYLRSAYWEICKKHYGPQAEEVYHFILTRYFLGENILEKLLSAFPIDFSKEDLLDIYRNHMPCIQLRSDARQLLSLLSHLKIPLGIISDGRTITQSNKVKALQLHEWISFDNIIISEQFGYSKPHPQAYEYFEMLYPNVKYYYVGDNINKDFITAKAKGWVTIGLIDNGDNIHKQNIEDYPANYHPNYWVNSLLEIVVV